MEDGKYLNEARYQKNKKKILFGAFLVLLIGIIIGGSIIFVGINKQKGINEKYSDNSKTSLQSQMNSEKQILEIKKSELENKGIVYTNLAKYTDGEIYDLKIITNALNPSFEYCNFAEYSNNSLTAKYCSLKNELEENDDFNKEFDSGKTIPFYMFGGFIIVASIMISLSMYMFGKRREIVAFEAQQTMPVVQEGIEKITPTVSSAAGTIAKEISKGIKEGKETDDEL